MEGIREEKTYVTVRDGWFTRKAMPSDDVTKLKVIERKDQINLDVYQFNRLVGSIISIYIDPYHTKRGPKDFLFIVVGHVGDERVLRLFLDSDPARAILDRIENIAPGQVVTFNVGRSEDRDFIWIEDENYQKIPLKYSAANPGSKPKWVERYINGEVVWDKTNQLNWYKDMVKNYLR